MTRARLAAIALAGLCPCHAAGAQPREALPCAMPEGPARQECSAKLWEALTGEKPAVKTVAPTPPGSGGWLVSETTSPVDCSPQVSASTLSHASAEDAPTSLSVGCRLQRIEISVSTAGHWKSSGNGQFRVVHRIDQRPAVEEQWIAVRDGRAASFKGDALAFLQSLPDSGLMSISVFDWQGPAHEADFRLDGLAAVRERVLAACKAEPTAERPTARQRR